MRGSRVQGQPGLHVSTGQLELLCLTCECGWGRGIALSMVTGAECLVKYYFSLSQLEKNDPIFSY